MNPLVYSSLAMVAIVGCVPPNPPAPAYFNWPAPNDPEARVKEWMAANLKDPDSVKAYKYEGIRQGKDGRWMAVVMWNAKNSYGAYTGVDEHYICFKGDIPTSMFSKREIDELNRGVGR